MNPAALPSLPLTFPPELFPIIASFIPLRSAPHTLLALALGNHDFYEIFRPLLYSRLILRNENDAIGVIRRIMDEPRLGLFVRELYIMSELSIKAPSQQGQERSDMVAGLQMLIAKGLIPHLVALGFYWLKDWVYDGNIKTIVCRPLLARFWSDLRNGCPRLHTLMLRNIGQSYADSWLDEGVVDEINAFSGLSVLRLEWNAVGPDDENDMKILKNISNLASSLHTLSLNTGGHDAAILLSHDFPNLKWLRLHRFLSRNDTEIVRGFLERHPQLESLSLECYIHTWFSGDIEAGFLPNLKHLKAKFRDICILLPILPQLVSLGINESYNGQVPYLLRVMLPNGLPRLRSLEIEQRALNWAGLKSEEIVMGWDEHTLEGGMWYETLDGQFHTERNRNKVQRDFTNGYMHSIVKGAPNLEELALQGTTLTSASLQTLAPALSQLVNLKRFYYHGFSPDPKNGNPPLLLSHKFLHAEFLSSAEALGRVCMRLESVTSISGKSLPYPSGAIERNSVGDVTVRPVDGVGLLISADVNDPFPCCT